MQDRKQLSRAARLAIVACLFAMNSSNAIADGEGNFDSSPTPRAQSQKINDKWAVVVGIGKYKDPRISPLKYPKKDARDFYDFLINDLNFQKDHVRFLCDEDCTRSRVMKELSTDFLSKAAKHDDLAVVFISAYRTPSKLDTMGENYVCLYDSNPDDLFASGLSLKSLSRILGDRLSADRVVIIVDASYGGRVLEGGRGGLRRTNASGGTQQFIITSCNEHEQSWESKRYANSVFTRQLIDGLKTNGKQTSLNDAYLYLSKKVAGEVKADQGEKNSQTPSRNSAEGSELILSTPPANASPPGFTMTSDSSHRK